jgi:hypothetical protein
LRTGLSPALLLVDRETIEFSILGDGFIEFIHKEALVVDDLIRGQ